MAGNDENVQQADVRACHSTSGICQGMLGWAVEIFISISKTHLTQYQVSVYRVNFAQNNALSRQLTLMCSLIFVY